MEMEEILSPDNPSPLRNVTGGLGCGCGCLGMLTLMLASIALAGIPLEFYADGPGNIPILAGAGLLVGLLVFLLGAVVWIGSLFLE